MKRIDAVVMAVLAVTVACKSGGRSTDAAHPPATSPAKTPRLRAVIDTTFDPVTGESYVIRQADDGVHWVVGRRTGGAGLTDRSTTPVFIRDDRPADGCMTIGLGEGLTLNKCMSRGTGDSTSLTVTRDGGAITLAAEMRAIIER